MTPYAELFGGKWVVYAFVDYLDNPTNVTLTTGFPADPYKRRDVGAGVNWLPQTNLRFRLGYGRAKYFGPDTVVDPSTRDFDQVDLSTVIAF